jgi:hypothetical protein
MKRLMWLLCAMVIVGCAEPMPDMPPYVGERNGVEYYMEENTRLTLDEATEMVEVAVAGWGKSMDDVRGLKVAFLQHPIECGDVGQRTGCYFYNGMVRIVQLTNAGHCRFFVPIAHELWHHFYAHGREPTQEEVAQIFDVDEIVFTHFLTVPGGCYR